jgi:hypothetical protein
MTSAINGIRLPTRSAHSPNTNAPIGRMNRVAVVRKATSVVEM